MPNPGLKPAPAPWKAKLEKETRLATKSFGNLATVEELQRAH